MTRYLNPNYAYAATALALALGAPANAQDASSATAAGVQAGGDMIVVTARRVEEDVQDVPISMTVYSQSELTKRNITAATDLATYTPSLQSNDRYGPEKSSFSIRGFNQDQSTAPTVGVYFADVVGVRAQGGTTSGNTVGAGSFMDLENVQILKGPQGTLFGRNTTGGAVLLVPTKPTDEFEGYVEASIGNYDMYRVQGAINIPLADTFKFRLAADHMDRDGYMRNRSGVGPDHYNDRNYYAIRGSVVAELTPDLENYTIAQYTKSSTNGYANRILACDRNATTPTTQFLLNDPRNPFAGFSQIDNAVDLRTFTNMSACEQVDRQAARGDGPLDVDVSNPNPFLELEQWQVINTTTWQASDELTIKNIISYGEFRERAAFNLYSDNFSVPQGVENLVLASIANNLNMGAPLPIPNATNPAAQLAVANVPVLAGTPYKYIQLDLQPPGRNNSAQSTFTEELQLQYASSDGKFNGVIGGYLEFSRPLGFNAGHTGIYLSCTTPEDPTTCGNFFGFGNISRSSTKFDFDNHGVFAQGTYNITDQFAITGGIRYTFDKIVGFDNSTRLGVAPGPAGGGVVVQNCRDSFRFPNPANPTQGLPVTDPNTCGKTLTNKSNEPTWLINLDYKPTQDILLYGKYARGYRQGGLNFTNPGIETWVPEKIEAFEIGAKVSYFGDIRGYFNIAGFYNDLSNQQIFGALVSDTPGVSGGAAIINAGSAVTQGVEIDASATFYDLFNLSVGYSYIDSEVKQVDPAAAKGDGSALGQQLVGTPFGQLIPLAVQGSQITYTPEHKLTVTGTFFVPIPDEYGDLSLSATYTYTDDQITNASLLAHPLAGNTVAARLPSYDLLNLNLDWERVGGSPFDLSLFATNITNEKYVVATGGGFNSSGIIDGIFGQPRMYGARIRFNWGPDAGSF